MTGEARQKAELYARDLAGAEWLSAPGSTPDDRLEAAFFPDGAVALRNPADPEGTVLFYDAAEWDAFVRGAQDGEFDR